MKPDTEELDLARGRQLVEIGRSYRPTPPDDLVRFIDGVPTARRRSRWSRTFGRHATLVRGTLLAAAALLVAAAATTAIVNVRNNQDAATAQGWSWHAVSGSQVRFGYLRTPGGYLANCSSNTGEATPCSSRD